MELRILAPTGALGAGFDADALARGLAARPDVIACDAAPPIPAPPPSARASRSCPPRRSPAICDCS
ncbi:hypothetical protein ACFQ10_47980 [Streptomyces indonesiensis]